MKLFKGIISIFLLFAIVSCNTTDDTVSSSMEKIDNDVAETGSKMVEVEVEEIVYFVAKAEAFYGDGQVDTITTYNYDENFDLISKIQANEQEEVLESFYNTIENGKVIRRNNLGFSNVLNNYITYTYNDNGLTLSDTMFDDEDQIQSMNEYEYDGSDMVVWKTLGPSGGLLAITEYEYDKNHNNIKVNIKDGLGSIDAVIEKSYKDNLLVEEKVLDSKGKAEKSTQYVYDGDILVEKVYFDKKGKKKRSESYEFDPTVPVPNKINLLYSSGQLDAYTMYEYDSKIVKTTILVEE